MTSTATKGYIAELDGGPVAEREKPGRKTVLALKGSPEWAGWLGELADYCGLPAANLIDSLLAEHARQKGFPKPMPKRGSR